MGKELARTEPPILDQLITVVRRKGLARKTGTTYRAACERFFRWARDRSGKWVHPRDMGRAEPLELAGWTREAKFRAVGNGVPLSVGRVLAAAVRAVVGIQDSGFSESQFCTAECKAPDVECENSSAEIFPLIPESCRLTTAPARVGPPGECDCRCGCGREVAGGAHRSATAACRKRLQLQRERARPFVDAAGYHE